ncbi:MAG: HAD hydrolase-like protein [Planctomycetota bacterium]|nr:HAD hydrolase-like protein [Planctomycetota bacterium]
MPATPFLFDAVVFDLDGTLVATDRFWVDAARVGARRAFAELGLERPLPTAAEWMSLVGLPLAQGFARLFPDLDPASRARVMAACEEEDHRALRAGGAALLPGVAETLDALRARGVRLGIASNCGRDYLASMMDDLGLARWVEEARCLDSAGTPTKPDMVASLLERFGTRAAVMVGDRLGDRDAAWANGLPHVHLARGFAPAGEEVEAEAVIETMPELVPRLERRASWIEGALEWLDVDLDAPQPTIGVTGPPGAGKSYFARDVGRILEARGRPTAVVALEDHLRTGPDVDLGSTAFVAGSRPLDLLTQGYDLAGLDARIATLPAGTTAIVHGPFLAHPALRPKLARLVHLAVDEAVCLRRLAGRDARSHGPEALLRVRRHLLPASRAFDAAMPPREHTDLVLDAANALGV